MMTDRITIRFIGQYTDFGRIYMKTPKALMHEEMFAILDNHDKIAYSYMLDRAALSAKNGWVDCNGHVYIYFTVEEACRILKLGRTKVAKIFKVLTQVGLIERVPQGLGRPVIIYVKDIVVNEVEEEHDPRTYGSQKDAREASVCSQNVDNSAILAESENSEAHRRPFSECSDDRETTSNKTEKNNTEYISNSNNYINPIHRSESEKNDEKPVRQSESDKGDKPRRITIDDIDDVDHLREIIKGLVRKHIKYTCFEDYRPDDMPMVDDIVELMTDVIMTDDNEITISRIPRNGDFVRQRFMFMKSDEVEYVIDSVKRVPTHIRNMRQYLLTSLYNAPDTIENYYNSIYMSSMTNRVEYRRKMYA